MLAGARAVKLVKDQRLGTVAGDKFRRNAVKALAAIPFYNADDILHHLNDPHIDAGAVEEQVLG